MARGLRLSNRNEQNLHRVRRGGEAANFDMNYKIALSALQDHSHHEVKAWLAALNSF
jgi:hypothetical protein